MGRDIVYCSKHQNPYSYSREDGCEICRKENWSDFYGKYIKKEEKSEFLNSTTQ